MKIAIVDDSRAVHAFLEDLFSGIAVLDHFYDGKQVIDFFQNQTNNVDLILLDWEMPIMTGIDSLPKLKLLTKAPIVMMTSKNNMSDISLAINNGASDYLMKPFTKEIMIEKVNSILNS